MNQDDTTTAAIEQTNDRAIPRGKLIVKCTKPPKSTDDTASLKPTTPGDRKGRRPTQNVQKRDSRNRIKLAETGGKFERTTLPTAGSSSLDVEALRPSVENDQLYRPVDPTDPDFLALVESIRTIGIREPLTAALGGEIISGHRRYAAALAAGLRSVPCRIVDIRRSEHTSDEWLALLREHNRQRVKTIDEMFREEIVSADPDTAYEALVELRDAKSDMLDFSGEELEMKSRQGRKEISEAKKPMLIAVARILEDQRAFWPLSVRRVHYALLNIRPLKHASKPKSIYANDRASYNNLCDLLTRARLIGSVSWDSVDDETRPVMLTDAHASPQPFIRRALKWFLGGYRRDLMQSQPDHIEILGEKLTVKNIIEPIARKFCIPTTIGRGYSSIPPRYKMALRFQRSGKERLVLLILSDFDPDGESIAESFARSMRDDFGIENIVPIKVALNADQARTLELPTDFDGMKAKPGSSTYKQFVAEHGPDVFELEALAPADLQRILTEAIDSVIDTEMFNAELEQERLDSVTIATARERATLALAGMDGGAS